MTLCHGIEESVTTSTFFLIFSLIDVTMASVKRGVEWGIEIVDS